MTIINTIELTKTAPVVNIIMLISIVLMVLSFIIVISVSIKHEKVESIFCLILFLSMIGLLICAGVKDKFVVPSGEYRYEILIDDNVTFNEVNEKYDIIEQRGEIFVVEEKNNEHD